MPDVSPDIPRLVITDFPFPPPDQVRLRAALGDDKIVFTSGAQALREALAAHPETDVVISFFPPDDLLTLAPNLRWLALSSAGAEQVFRAGLPQSAPNLLITTASGIHAVPISEYVLSVMLMWVRQWTRLIALQHEREWPQQGRVLGGELAGATLGIIGLGSIGRRIAQLGHALGMRVVAQRRGATPGQSDPDADELLPPDRLADLLAQADFVVISAPNTPETRHLIDATRLRQMKHSAVLINIARGNLVNEEALIAALRDGTIAGAGLDVVATEPLPIESPLWSMPNVILSPHLSGLTIRYGERLTTLFLDNLARYRANQPLINLVDAARGY
ncbi:MAG TPA: D-2-hydroxyacid dehydrogenase [Ktedonobacterales bacterium]|nr:D-2-hydroxyacid dehydrogenase [Ktedonobacterales bacterium]